MAAPWSQTSSLQKCLRFKPPCLWYFMRAAEPMETAHSHVAGSSLALDIQWQTKSSCPRGDSSLVGRRGRHDTNNAYKIFIVTNYEKE